MMKLKVWAWIPQENWHIPRHTLIEIEAVAIRAGRQEGAGSAAITFEAKGTNGTWYPMKKKDNPCAKLPKSTDMTWKQPTLVNVRGLRGIYDYETEEFAI